jgi:hypothetical protein
MTINSIEYITKKHFHSLINLLVTLIALAIAALACCLSYFSAFSPVWTAIAAFTCFSALSALVRVFAPGKGCSLLRLSISITALVCFFSGMASFTLGYLLIRHPGTQDYVNELISGFGYIITMKPETTGTVLLTGSVLLYLASGCAFFCHRYLGAVRSCASGVLKRSGLRVFPLLSALLFFLCLIIAGTIAFLQGGDRLRTIPMNRTTLSAAALTVLLYLHLLFSGVNASVFGRRTFAFKVFQKQIMKVETNADGTVYVPINEDQEPDTEEPLASSKAQTIPEEEQSGKSFIKEFAASSDESDPTGERNIL